MQAFTFGQSKARMIDHKDNMCVALLPYFLKRVGNKLSITWSAEILARKFLHIRKYYQTPFAFLHLP